MWRFLMTVIHRDLLLAARRKGDWLTAQFFFVMVVSMFPLGIGADPEQLRRVAGGVLWVAALLASLLSLARLYADDHRDGSLEQMLLSPQPALILALGKAVAHWLIFGLPLLFIAPLLGLQFALPPEAIVTLVISLAIGTPVLSLLGGVGAALTLGLRGGGTLLTLLILPLYVPALIFGAGAVDGVLAGMGAEAQLSLLGAFMGLCLLLAPWVTGAALRVSVD